jgi:hypothetical protein
VDSNRTDVLDSYAYGLASGWWYDWTPGCDETAPEPPVVEAPGEGARLLTAHPVFLGTTEALSTVRLYEDGVELGATQADRSGRFVMAATLPLLSGVHTVTATATDVQGNTSLPSAPRSFETAQLSELVNNEPQDKLRVLSFELGPNPFDPSTELNRLTVELEVDGVKGLGGNSPKHRFVAMMRRTMRDAQTGAVVATVYASTELDNGLSLQGFELSDGWDGRDELGELVEPNRAYSLEVEVMVARFWTGKGNGPGCGPEDLQEALRIGASPGVFERISALPACCVSVRPLVRAVLDWCLSLVTPQLTIGKSCEQVDSECVAAGWTELQCFDCAHQCLLLCDTQHNCCSWPSRDMNGNNCVFYLGVPPQMRVNCDPARHEARDCDEAFAACQLTTSESEQPGRCAICRTQCENLCFDENSATFCTWRDVAIPYTHCRYWDSPFLLLDPGEYQLSGDNHCFSGWGPGWPKCTAPPANF